MSTLLYVPLPHARCIRVAKLLNHQPDEVCKLSIALTNVDIGAIDGSSSSISAATYDALSYTWGSPFSTPSLRELYTQEYDVSISLETALGVSQRSIGRNLYEGLAQLREAEHRGYLWIDSLCINQDDLQEKTMQVQLMGDIFASAASVIIWFGIDDPDLPTINHVQHYSDQLELVDEVEDSIDEFASCHTIVKDDGTITAIELAKTGVRIEADVLKSVYRFYARRRYLSRSWVVQEVVLGRDIKALLNGKFTELERLMDGALGMFVLSGITKPLSVSEDHQESCGEGHELLEFACLLDRRKEWHDTEPSGPLRKFKQAILEQYCPSDEQAWYLSLLQYYLTNGPARRCSNPRDAIYSRLGYLGALFPSIRCPVRLDYAVATETIFIEVTQLMLERLPHCTILSAVHDRHGPSEHMTERYALPSWVPDYARRTNRHASILGRLHTTSVTNLVELGHIAPEDHFLLDEIPLLSTRFSAGIEEEKFPSPSVSGLTLSVYARYCSPIVRTFPLDYLNMKSSPPWQFQRCLLAILREALDSCVSAADGIDQARCLLLSYWQVSCCPSALLGLRNISDFCEKLTVISMSTLWRSVLAVKYVKDPAAVELVQQDLDAIIAHYSALHPCDFLPSSHFLAHFRSGRREDLSCRDLELLEMYKDTQLYYAMPDHSCTFMTESKLIGNAGANITTEDQLWLICDAMTPFVLRPRPDGTFTLVSEALVDHAMLGELIEDGSAGEPQLIKIV